MVKRRPNACLWPLAKNHVAFGVGRSGSLSPFCFWVGLKLNMIVSGWRLYCNFFRIKDFTRMHASNSSWVSEFPETASQFLGHGTRHTRRKTMIRNLKRQKYEALRNTTVDLKESKCNFGLPLSVLLGHRRGLRCSLPRGPLRCAGLHYGTIQLKTYCFCLSCTRGGAPSFRSDLHISKKKKKVLDRISNTTAHTGL